MKNPPEPEGPAPGPEVADGAAPSVRLSQAAAEAPASPEGGREPGEAKRRRQQILRAAVEVFAERGFTKTRVSDIAKKAGVAYGLIYHYFHSKEAVLSGVFDASWGVFLKVLHQIADDPVRDAPEKLGGASDFLIDALREEPAVVQVLIQEISRSERFALPGRREAFGLIRTIIADGQAKGELQPDLDPQIGAYIFFGALETLATISIGKKFPLETAADADAIKRVVRRILLDGLRTRTEGPR